jgi:hypothetical protein
MTCNVKRQEIEMIPKREPQYAAVLSKKPGTFLASETILSFDTQHTEVTKQSVTTVFKPRKTLLVNMKTDTN